MQALHGLIKRTTYFVGWPAYLARSTAGTKLCHDSGCNNLFLSQGKRKERGGLGFSEMAGFVLWCDYVNCVLEIVIVTIIIHLFSLLQPVCFLYAFFSSWPMKINNVHFAFVYSQCHFRTLVAAVPGWLAMQSAFTALKPVVIGI